MSEEELKVKIHELIDTMMDDGGGGDGAMIMGEIADNGQLDRAYILLSRILGNTASVIEVVYGLEELLIVLDQLVQVQVVGFTIKGD